jgi:hypothetical protein
MTVTIKFVTNGNNAKSVGDCIFISTGDWIDALVSQPSQSSSSWSTESTYGFIHPAGIVGMVEHPLLNRVNSRD